MKYYYRKRRSQARLVVTTWLAFKSRKRTNSQAVVITIISPLHIYRPPLAPPLHTAERPSWTCAVLLSVAGPGADDAPHGFFLCGDGQVSSSSPSPLPSPSLLKATVSSSSSSISSLLFLHIPDLPMPRCLDPFSFLLLTSAETYFFSFPFSSHSSDAVALLCPHSISISHNSTRRRALRLTSPRTDTHLPLLLRILSRLPKSLETRSKSRYHLTKTHANQRSPFYRRSNKIMHSYSRHKKLSKRGS